MDVPSPGRDTYPVHVSSAGRCPIHGDQQTGHKQSHLSDKGWAQRSGGLLSWNQTTGSHLREVLRVVKIVNRKRVMVLGAGGWGVSVQWGQSFRSTGQEPLWGQGWLGQMTASLVNTLNGALQVAKMVCVHSMYFPTIKNVGRK